MICLEDLHEKRHEMESGTDRDADDDVGNGIDTSARSYCRCQTSNRSETIARVHDQWQQKKQEEKQKQRIRQQKLEQERMRKERQKRKQEQRKRARKARIRRAKQKQKRDEKNRRLAIEEKCGRVIGTESERILQRIVEAEAGGENTCCECHFESCVRKTVSIHDQGSSLCT